MKVAVIHGQGHKGVTYTMTGEVLARLIDEGDEIAEFFLPKDGPDFCCGCNRCFLNVEACCPGAERVQPIARAMEEADVIVLDSPNYVMEMSGPMKNLMDHLAYRWVTHRPHGAMFTKVGVTVCSSAGAPAGHTARSMAKQLKWMGVSKVYCLPLACNAMGPADLKPEKRAAIERGAAQVAAKVRRRVARPRPSLRGRVCFEIFRRMQAQSQWNHTDRDWWVAQGWTGKNRPWRESGK